MQARVLCLRASTNPDIHTFQIGNAAATRTVQRSGHAGGLGDIVQLMLESAGFEPGESRAAAGLAAALPREDPGSARADGAPTLGGVKPVARGRSDQPLTDRCRSR